jgi:hypothetical protein
MSLRGRGLDFMNSIPGAERKILRRRASWIQVLHEEGSAFVDLERHQVPQSDEVTLL